MLINGEAINDFILGINIFREHHPDPFNIVLDKCCLIDKDVTLCVAEGLGYKYYFVNLETEEIIDGNLVVIPQ